MKTKISKNRKILISLVSLFSTLMCISTGFATWLVTSGTNALALGNIEADEFVPVIPISFGNDETTEPYSYFYYNSTDFVDDGSASDVALITVYYSLDISDLSIGSLSSTISMKIKKDEEYLSNFALFASSSISSEKVTILYNQSPNVSKTSASNVSVAAIGSEVSSTFSIMSISENCSVINVTAIFEFSRSGISDFKTEVADYFDDGYSIWIGVTVE